MSDCGNDPTKAMPKMMQDYAAWMTKQTAFITEKTKNVTVLESQLLTIKAKAEREHGGIVNDRIKRFMDECVSKRVPPYQRPVIEASLRNLDAVTVRKFSDGKQMGSALDEQMAIIEAWPINPQLLRKFSDSTANVVAAGVGNSTADKLAIAKRVLGTTIEGQKLIEPMVKRYTEQAAAV